jgi:hypothetical protein
MIKTIAIRTATILVGVGMLSGCSPAWISGGFKLDKVELPIIETLAEHDLPLFSTRLEQARSANTPPKLTLVRPSLDVERGSPVFLGPNDPEKSLYTATDAEDGPPKLSIVSSLDGPLPLEDFSFPNLGTRVLRITATDAQGLSAQAKLTINVKRIRFVVLKFAPGHVPTQPMGTQ